MWRLKKDHSENRSAAHCEASQPADANVAFLINMRMANASNVSNKYALHGRVGYNSISFLHFYHNFTSTSQHSSCSVPGHRPRMFDVDYLMSHLLPHGEQSL